MARKKNANTKPAAEDRTDAAGTVTVACRLPAGLSVDVRGHGTLHFRGSNDKRALALADEQGFHGLTTGVPADAWDALTEQYAKAKWLTGGFVFAATKSKDAVKEAQARGPVNAGFDQLDPENLPADVAAVVPDDVV